MTRLIFGVVVLAAILVALLSLRIWSTRIKRLPFLNRYPELAISQGSLVMDDVQFVVTAAVKIEGVECSSRSEEFHHFLIRIPFRGEGGVPALRAREISCGADQDSKSVSDGFGDDRLLVSYGPSDGSLRHVKLIGSETGRDWGVLQSWDTEHYCASGSGKALCLDGRSVHDLGTGEPVQSATLTTMLSKASTQPDFPGPTWHFTEDLAYLISTPEPLAKGAGIIRVLDSIHGCREFPINIGSDYISEAGSTRGRLRFFGGNRGLRNVDVKIFDENEKVISSFKPIGVGLVRWWDAANHRMLFYSSTGNLKSIPEVEVHVYDYETGEIHSISAKLGNLFELKDGRYILKPYLQ